MASIALPKTHAEHSTLLLCIFLGVAAVSLIASVSLLAAAVLIH